MVRYSGRPGFDVDVRRLPPDAEPLRSDIAGFAGLLPAGPVRRAVTVQDLEEFAAVFGLAAKASLLGRAVRGYFANGGTLARIVRVDGSAVRRSVEFADGERATGIFLAEREPGVADLGLRAQLELRRSTGTTALEVTLDVVGAIRRRVLSRQELDSTTFVVGSGLRIDAMAPLQTRGIDQLEGQSHLVARAALPAAVVPQASSTDWHAAAQQLLDDPSVAIVCVPGIWEAPWTDRRQAVEIVAELVAGADAQLDRIVALDLPRCADAAAAADLRAQLVAALGDERFLRSVACYAPWVSVEETPRPFARDSAGSRVTVSPIGHVAGVMSLLDRTRGIGRSPANAYLDDVADLALPPRTNTESFRATGVNPISCMAGRGLQIWGARTLAIAPYDILAHRRLLTRLVRAVRAVTEPLVFEPNTVPLRFAVRRAIGTVLLEAFRSGALAGANPAEAFFVVCDDTTMSEDDVQNGRLVCEVGFAPSQPIEFIRLRVTVGDNGQLEVVEQ